MDNIKPWQIVLFVVAIGVLGFSVWKYGMGSSIEAQLSNSLTLIDLETGQLYTVDIRGNRGIVLPAMRPGTDELALLPVYEETGEWYLIERYSAGLEELDVPTTALPTPSSPLMVNGQRPIPYSP